MVQYDLPIIECAGLLGRYAFLTWAFLSIEVTAKDCQKKSKRKLNLVYNENPEVFDFSINLDEDFSHIKPQVLPDGTVKQRKRHRGYQNTNELIATFDISAVNPKVTKKKVVVALKVATVLKTMNLKPLRFL